MPKSDAVKLCSVVRVCSGKERKLAGMEMNKSWGFSKMFGLRGRGRHEGCVGLGTG